MATQEGVSKGVSGRRGVLIAVEGLDGSGKSTQIYLLRRWLELEGYRVYFTEWNSSVLVKAATKKGKKLNLLTPRTFCLIHATDFADRFERQVLPLLRADYIVLADRYIYTAMARDAVRHCNPQWVRKVYSFAVPPDITYFFDVPLETSLGRILGGRPQLKYHEAGMDLGLSDDPYESFRIFQGRIREEYLKIVDEFGLVRIDAAKAIEEQQQEVRRILQEKVDLAQYKLKGARYNP
ncbi:MAG: dTMP kinase [Candidatus Sumerlaeota bacterium]|nr:dTMP kinase [Candidatus Sumerlaeota bacterium]